MKYARPLLILFGLLVFSCEGKKTADEYFSISEKERNAKNVQSSVQNLELLIKYYPAHDLSAQSQYLLGDIYMNDLRDFESAVSAYRTVVDKYSETIYAPRALFMVGYVQGNYMNNFETSKNSYNEFLEKYSDHELAPSVEFEIENLGKDINEIPVLKHITS